MVFFSSFMYEIIDICKEISYIVSGGDLHFTAMQEDIYGNKNKLEFGGISMDKDKRKLTEKEIKRKDRFEKLSSEMQQKGYKIKNMTITTQQAKYLGFLIMMPFMAFVFWMYYTVNGFDLDCISWGYAVALPLSIVCIVILHEFIHGITWCLFAKNHFHSIDFGIIWSSIAPYCTCSEPLKKWQYLLGTAMPTLVLVQLINVNSKNERS